MEAWRRLIQRRFGRSTNCEGGWEHDWHEGSLAVSGLDAANDRAVPVQAHKGGMT